MKKYFRGFLYLVSLLAGNNYRKAGLAVIIFLSNSHFIQNSARFFLYPFIFPFIKILGLNQDFKLSIISSRIGHLSLDADIFLRKVQLNKVKSKNYYFFVTPIALNKDLFEMFKRNKDICIFKSFFICFLIESFGALLKENNMLYLSTHKGTEYDLFSTTVKNLFFNKTEKARGESFLKELGISLQKNDWYVCIFSRDPIYLNQAYPGFKPNEDWSYHNYRNFDIDDLIPSIEYIIKKGGYVIRVGNEVEKRVSYTNPKFIDYPFTHLVSGFHDLYLVANAKFILGSRSGITELASVFEVPWACINLTPTFNMPLGKRTLYVPKKIVHKKNRKLVSFKQIIKMKLDHTQAAEHLNILRKNDLNYLSLSKEEILEFTKEFFLYLNADQYVRCKEHDDNYFEIVKNSLYHKGYTPFIGKYFLENNLDLLA